MQINCFEEYSPINAKHAKENKDHSLSSSWNHMMPSYALTHKLRSEEDEISFLMARNKMARLLDCLFAKRVRFPFQLVKQKILFSQSDVSKSVCQQQLVNHESLEQISLGLQILKEMIKKIDQKSKVQAFSFMKSLGEEKSSYSNQPDTSWLKRQQIIQGSDMLTEVLRFKVISVFKQFFDGLKDTTKSCKQNSNSRTQCHTKYQSTLIEDKRVLSKNNFEQRINCDERYILTENTQRSEKVEKSEKKEQPHQKGVKYIYVVRERSSSKSSRLGSMEKFLRIPLITGIADAKQLGLQSKRRKSSRDINFFKPSIKSINDCCCESDKVQTSRFGPDSCKFCKLFTADLRNTPYTSRQTKYSFFSK